MISFHWTSWIWSGSVDFKLWFSFYIVIFIFHFIFYIVRISDKNVLSSIVNATYLIGCCDYTLINLVLKTIVLIFKTIHKMECCEYWYCFGWYNSWDVKSESLNYYTTRLSFFFWRDMYLQQFCCCCCFVLFVLFPIVCFWYLYYMISAFQ